MRSVLSCGPGAVMRVLPALLALLLAAPASAGDASRTTARPSPDWVKDAVVYEVFPRAFSARGDLAGVTARLGDLHDLGVTVLWLMPIHPVGRERAKGSV